MTTKESKEHRRPMNVYVRRGSKAEKAFRKRIGSPIPKAIVPGIAPSPDHDLKYQGGKTIQNLRFMNFYVGGDAWDPGDIANVDKALGAAMSDRYRNNVMVQYFPGPISTNFDGSQTLPGSAPQVISQGDVEQMVTTFYGGGKFTAHDLTSTVFNFMLPPGTVLKDGFMSEPPFLSVAQRDRPGGLGARKCNGDMRKGLLEASPPGQQ